MSDIDLNGFEQIHFGDSSDSYIMHSISDPRIHMGVKRGKFFESLLNKRAGDLQTGASGFCGKSG